MHAGTSPKDAYKTLSRRRLPLLASVATVAGALLLAGPGGNWKLNETALVGPAQAAESTGPAGFADLVTKAPGRFSSRPAEE